MNLWPVFAQLDSFSELTRLDGLQQGRDGVHDVDVHVLSDFGQGSVFVEPKAQGALLILIPSWQASP